MAFEEQPTTQPVEISAPDPQYQKVRIRFALIVAAAGFIIFLVGARPGTFGLDRSPVVGFIQIAVMLVGIGIICIGGYVAVRSLWRKEIPSIAFDIGMRLVSTGFVVTVFSGLADVFGIGSHPLTMVPFFGVWQARGMEIGSALIAIGFIMMFPYKNTPIDKTGISLP
jgi:hypothetical protein